MMKITPQEAYRRMIEGEICVRGSEDSVDISDHNLRYRIKDGILEFGNFIDQETNDEQWSPSRASGLQMLKRPWYTLEDDSSPWTPTPGPEDSPTTPIADLMKEDMNPVWLHWASRVEQLEEDMERLNCRTGRLAERLERLESWNGHHWKRAEMDHEESPPRDTEEIKSG